MFKCWYGFFILFICSVKSDISDCCIDSELNDIIEGFQILGSDSGGLVNPTELKEIMDIMNMSDKNPFLYNIIQTLCSDQEIQEKGGIEAKDFISLLNQELDDTSTNEGLHKIFSILYNLIIPSLLFSSNPPAKK